MTPADLTLVRALIRDVRAHFGGRGISGPLALRLADISGPLALRLADACEILIDDAEFWKEEARQCAQDAASCRDCGHRIGSESK